ncbi:glycosyltransferase [Thermodesulfobacterium commune]|uniref:Glycosyltransferase subfamily 4-like N-terminal domain-containing protein n=1 Tax=Thermodesulfobacterium commune DSM 2178 TaxID=289377 RepID=A0A075WU12_9BACT|nr:glycosyltransferase [Thermodesulfobacterium commune]AIH04366.1 hypothetical protein HL41_06290 [Thermodesulfobacterium commune DSM 2178]
MIRNIVNKQKILFLSSRLPYPPIGGDRLKNYWLLKILSKHFKAHLVSIVEEEIPKEFYDWTNEIGITFKLFPKRKTQFYLNALKSLYNGLPLQVNYYYFKDVQQYINSIYTEYDLIFSTLVRTAKYVMELNKPKILDMADSIGLNYRRSAQNTKSILWRFIYSYESAKLLEFEEKCIEIFDKTLFFNREEREFFLNENKTEWIPHGVNEDLLIYEKVNPNYKNYVAFFGKMNYQPNIDAVLWFIDKVFPHLNKNIKFIIVGAYPPKKITSLKDKYSDIEITGFVEDPYEILKSALCVVAPMRTGGGIQNKILECMALGTVNVVSSLAAKPIGAKNMEHFIVVDDPKEMANIINNIHAHPDKYEHIKRNAREYIKNNFTWTIYEKKY